MLLRAATPSDTGFLQGLWDDVDTWLLAQSRPYVPESQAHKARRLEAALDGPNANTLLLVVEADGQVVGVASLSGIDLHNRRADVAVSLAPQARGAGYGREALATLCDYGFRLRGLHRLCAETLSTNIAMQRVAESVGFVREGVRRAQDWQPAGWCDVVVYGLLADEWAEGHSGSG